MTNPRNQIEERQMTQFYRVYGYRDKWKSGPLHLGTSPLRTQGALCGHYDDLPGRLNMERELVTAHDTTGPICLRCLAAAKRLGWDQYEAQARREVHEATRVRRARERMERRAQPVSDPADWAYVQWLHQTRARLGMSIAWTVRATAHRIINADTGEEC